MFVILRSGEFDAWIAALADAKGKARILSRLRSATLGNFGDCEPVGEGVSEMRVHVGPGYRVYFTRTERTVLSPADRRRQIHTSKGYRAGQNDGARRLGE
jgi:putative addiction module killer protein